MKQFSCSIQKNSYQTIAKPGFVFSYHITTRVGPCKYLIHDWLLLPQTSLSCNIRVVGFDPSNASSSGQQLMNNPGIVGKVVLSEVGPPKKVAAVSQSISQTVACRIAFHKERSGRGCPVLAFLVCDIVSLKGPSNSI